MIKLSFDYLNGCACLLGKVGFCCPKGLIFRQLNEQNMKYILSLNDTPMEQPLSRFCLALQSQWDWLGSIIYIFLLKGAYYGLSKKTRTRHMALV